MPAARHKEVLDLCNDSHKSSVSSTENFVLSVTQSRTLASYFFMKFEKLPNKRKTVESIEHSFTSPFSVTVTLMFVHNCGANQQHCTFP